MKSESLVGLAGGGDLVPHLRLHIKDGFSSFASHLLQ